MSAVATRAKPGPSRGDKAGGGATRWPVLALALAGLGAALAMLPTTLVLVVGLLPSAVALFVDRDPARNGGVTVTALNLVGVMPVLLDLWFDQHTLNGALAALAHPWPWFVMYGAASVGWLVQYSLPPIVGSVLALGRMGHARELEARQAALVEEWGPEVATAMSAKGESIEPRPRRAG